MKRLPDDRDILAAEVVQRLYFEGPNTSQARVAREMKYEKSTISRLVQHAWTRGIVHVSLRLPRMQALEIRLKRRYELMDVAVAPVIPRSDSDERWMFRQQLGETAAAYLDREGGLLRSGLRIGISCGETLRDLVLALTPRRYSEMSVSQLTVETEYDWHVDSSPFALVSMLRSKWPVLDNDTYTYAVQPLPNTLRSEPEKTDQPRPSEREKDPGRYATHHLKIRSLAEQIDLALVGVSAVDTRGGGGTFMDILRRHGISTREIKSVGAIGEICNRVYDARGKDVTPYVPRLQEFLDGVDLSILKGRVEKGFPVVAVAGGPEKSLAIRVGLEAGYFNVLVTDGATAQALCDAD